MSRPYRDFVQGVQDVEGRGFLRRRLVCDVPGPREEQESPSSLVGDLRADRRKAAVSLQQRTRPGPKAGIDAHTRLHCSKACFLARVESRTQRGSATAKSNWQATTTSD